MGNFILFFFRKFDEVHLKKDVVLFPIYLSKYFKSTTIAYIGTPENKNIPEFYRGVKLIRLCDVEDVHTDSKRETKELRGFQRKALNYLKRSDISYSHIMLFHYNLENMYFIADIRKRYRDIKIYLKLDADVNFINRSINYRSPYIPVRMWNSYIKKRGLSFTDLITCETDEACKKLYEDSDFSGKIYAAPNGFDDVLLNDASVKKEKIILYVGRIGAPEKNTELILKIAAAADLRDWKIRLVGHIEENFKTYTDKFFEAHPELKDKIEFAGQINDSHALMNEYKKSSLLLFTSRFESSGLVLLEAAMNDLYILTTDVGIAGELSCGGKYIFVAPESKTGEQNEEKMVRAFSNEINNYTQGYKDPDKAGKELGIYVRERYLMSKISDYKCFKEWAADI